MRFRLNGPGVDQSLRQVGVIRFLNEVADRVVQGVESNAPERTGTFARSITKTSVLPDREGPKITVYSTDWAAHLVEFGSVNNVAYAPFRRAASSLGLRPKGGGGRP